MSENIGKGKTHYGHFDTSMDDPRWYVWCGLDYAEKLTLLKKDVTCKRCIKSMLKDPAP